MTFLPNIEFENYPKVGGSLKISYCDDVQKVKVHSVC